MKTLHEKFMDRKKWGKGPWDDEDHDKTQWMDSATNLPCLMVRGPLGSWCGYVGISKGHPYFEMGYNEPPVDVHGGLTFAGHCTSHICHKVEEGEDDDVWWFGFDTAHHMDMMPYDPYDYHGHYVRDGVYRDMRYVKHEVESLALQLKEFSK